jgi:hypothetical protein
LEEQDTDQSEAVAIIKKFEAEEGRLRGFSYVPQGRNEVVITTSPKAGTTWMQQVIARGKSVSTRLNIASTMLISSFRQMCH